MRESTNINRSNIELRLDPEKSIRTENSLPLSLLVHTSVKRAPLHGRRRSTHGRASMMRYATSLPGARAIQHPSVFPKGRRRDTRRNEERPKAPLSESVVLEKRAYTTLSTFGRSRVYTFVNVYVLGDSPGRERSRRVEPPSDGRRVGPRKTSTWSTGSWWPSRE